MRTIKLEILRHGPRHNQLLSPLTGYLALCENHDAHSIRLPEEHLQMMHRLRALGYQLGEESRQFQLRELSRLMGELLGNIPGLMAEINGSHASGGDNGHDPQRLVHLRLITSASELALLPFELALAPHGFPGAGQPLLLQTNRPICLTRETRRSASATMVWARKPKILFAFASPPGLPEVPAQAHLLALRTALSPWLALLPNATQEEELAALAEKLTVLPMASAAALQQACASGQYSHVHLLAHGEAYQDTASGGLQRRYGLALHADHDPGQRDIVDADRLATLLNSAVSGHQPHPSADGLPVTPPAKLYDRPCFVSLASCNAGNQGDVAGVGASIAHTLHASGIPFVVASQFPLSFQGSVTLVERLYQGLLWGRDPRQLLVDLRRDLHSGQPHRHDWAALSVYASVPRDFDQQLIDCRITQARDAIDAALGTADKALAVLQRHHVEPAGSPVKKPGRSSKPAEGEAQDQRPRSKSAAVKTADTASAPVPLEFTEHDFNVIDAQTSRAKAELRLILAELLSTQQQGSQQAWCKSQRGRVLSLIASTEKREAELRWHRLDHKIGQPTTRFDPATGMSGTDKAWAEVLDRLRSAQQHYDLAFQAEGQAWQQVQYLAIRLFRLALDPQDDNRYQSLADLPEVWKMLLMRTRHAIESSSGDEQAWACGDLLELQLLGPLMSALQAVSHGEQRSNETQEFDYEHDLARAMDAAHRLVRGTGESSFPVASTRRQVGRYANWIWRMMIWAERQGMRRPQTATAKTIQQAFKDPVRKMAQELLEVLPA